MKDDLTREQLIEIGVNPDNLYDGGEMNIIVQSFGMSNEKIEKGDLKIYPDIYHPRKNSVWSCGCAGEPLADFTNQEQKEEYVKHLKDSAERLKIMSYYLMKQVEEIEELGYPVTTLYYPE